MRLPSPLPVAIAFATALAVKQWLAGPAATVPPPGSIADDRIDDRIEGVVDGAPIETRHGYGALVDTGATEVWVWTELAVVPGERIAAIGKLRTPRGMLDPGAPRQPMHAPFELAATRIERRGVEPGVRARAWRWATSTQARWAARIDDAVGDRRDRGGAALRGIVTGDRGDVPDELDQRWRVCGIFHALSVSGLHLAVVAGLAFALLRRIAASSPWGGRIRPARWAAPPALVLAIAYTLVTGAQIATLRALLVVAIVLVAQMLDRPVRLVDALGLTAIVVLACRPADLGDPSFQLSFVAALALALKPPSPPALTRRGRIAHWLARGISTSSWVAIATAPVTAYHFHQVAAGGVIGNLVLTPILELVALPLGLVGLVVGAVWPALGAVLLRVAAWTVGLVDDLAGVLARITPVGTIAVASALVMAALVALSLWLVARPRQRGSALAWIAMCVVWTCATSRPPPGALRVTFLDVGQGDAAVIELPDGAVWLVDAGGLPGRRDLAAASATGRAIDRTLEAYGRDAIELAIISHPHPDHYLGLAALTVPVTELWTARDESPAVEPPAALPSFGTIAKTLGAPITHPPLGLARTEAGVELVVWAPRYRDPDGEREAIDPVRTVNDNSLVVELRYAGRSIVFAGDLEAEGEADVVAAGLGHVDVVKVAHHGSPTSSSPGFVAATRPEVAVISCGVANAFGFPSPAVVDRWRAAGASVERTDVAGAIAVTISATGGLALDRAR